MNPEQVAAALSVGLFFGMVVCLEVGYRLGRRSSENPELAHEGVGAIEAAVFALLGLLLGFSLAGGTSRLDTRRQLIIEEANAIGTAYLCLDLLATDDQPQMRRFFREYLEARLRVYQKPDPGRAEQELAHAAQIQQRIWSQAVIVTRTDPTQTSARLLLPALNQMIDVTTSRTVWQDTHLPALIFALLMGRNSGVVRPKGYRIEFDCTGDLGFGNYCSRHTYDNSTLLSPCTTNRCGSRSPNSVRRQCRDGAVCSDAHRDYITNHDTCTVQ